MTISVRSTRKRRPPERLIKEYKKKVQNTFRSIGMKGKIAIKSEIKKRDLIDTGEMYNNVRFKITEKGVTFIVGVPYAKIIDKGVRRHKMRYLLKATKPIPLETVNGLMFRWATKESMGRGKWIHPGFKRGKRFMHTAIQRTRVAVREDLEKIKPKIF